MSTNHKLTTTLFKHRKFRATFALLVLLSTLLGVLIVPVERTSPKARILSIEDGLWWAVTTVTGVGYGDMVPVTTSGRMVGALLEISGVIMFGLIIGIIGITLSKRQEEYAWFRLFERLDQIEGKIDALEKKSRFLVNTQAQANGASENLSQEHTQEAP